MSRPVTLFTGQWADLTLDTIAAKAKGFGYDGLELACWGDHFEATKAAKDAAYCKTRWDILGKHGLKCFAISSHLVGQAVCDHIDGRHRAILPPHVWGEGEPEGVRRRAAEEMKLTAKAAARLGVKVVNGFTGSSIWGMWYFFPPTGPDHVKAGFDDFAKRWGPILDAFKAEGVKFALEVHPGEIAYDVTAKAAARLGVKVVNGFTGSSIWGMWYFFPPTGPDHVKAGFDDFAKRWGPILDAFKAEGVKFALEVHPGEIAYDVYTAEMALAAVGNHPAFGFNFDPSHLLWQGIAPNKFIERFADRIFHVHMKDVAVHYGPGNNRGGDGLAGVLGSHLAFGDVRRGWDFRSVGRGHVTWEAIIRSLNRIGYKGPLSVEWEDAGMDREAGARESCAFVKRLDFEPSAVAFDAAFEKKQ